MVGVAAGMSACGKIPFVSTFAAFLTRGFDQIRMARISRANIRFVGSHCGISIGQDGPSQMGLEDIAMFRAIPDSVVLYPSDAVSTEHLVARLADHEGISYLRTTRPKAAVIYDSDEVFEIGGSKTLRRSDDDKITVVGAGITLHEALKAYDILNERGCAIRVIDAYSVKPIDAEGLIRQPKKPGDGWSSSKITTGMEALATPCSTRSATGPKFTRWRFGAFPGPEQPTNSSTRSVSARRVSSNSSGN